MENAIKQKQKCLGLKPHHIQKCFQNIINFVIRYRVFVLFREAHQYIV